MIVDTDDMTEADLDREIKWRFDKITKILTIADHIVLCDLLELERERQTRVIREVT